MLRDQSRPANHLERMPGPVVVPLPARTHDQERKRLLIALGVLLVALVAVVVKDWDFWFPPRPEAEDAVYIPSHAKVAPRTPASAPAMVERKPVKPAEHAATAAAAPLTAHAERTALPPLEVEVVAGNRHTKLPARSNAIQLDVGKDVPVIAAPPVTAAPPAAVAPPAVVASSAADRVQLSAAATQSVTKPVAPNYPLLARQMKVQGAVVLQALISREGTIQELQVMSGPAILATAAREAVRQWRFKPYLLNGEPVETQAKITVNFTISTN